MLEDVRTYRREKSVTFNSDDRVWIQVNEVLPPPRDKFYMFHKNTAAKIKVRMHRRHSTNPLITQVRTREKLVSFVRNNYGFGKFLVTFRVKWMRFKTYSPFHVCPGYPRESGSTYFRGGCEYYGRGDKCRKWNVLPYKVGMTCRKNRKHGSNWQTRAMVEIKERAIEQADHGIIPTEEGDYTYIWHNRRDRMSHFKWYTKKDKTENEPHHETYPEPEDP